MDLVAPGGVSQEYPLRGTTHTLRIILTDESVRAVVGAQPDEALLMLDPRTQEPSLSVRTQAVQIRTEVPSTPELHRVLQINNQVRLNVRTTDDQQLLMTGQVLRPEPTKIILRTEQAFALMAKPPSVPHTNFNSENLPSILQAVSKVSESMVTHSLATNNINFDLDSMRASLVKDRAVHTRLPTELTKSVLQSIRTVGGLKPMLIPDISAAVPRAISPDALPTAVPIRQPIANELGLKVGQVVQALVASSGDKSALQLGQYQIPLPPQMKLPEGQFAVRVIQTEKGLGLMPQVAQQAHTSQSLSTAALSPALAAILTRSGTRSHTQNLFAPQGLESILTAAGLFDEAKKLAGRRLTSNHLTSDLVKSAVQFGALGNERALLEGVALQGGILKPWLRQILRMLPQQSEIRSRIDGLVTELEGLQIEALPQSQARESALAAVLLFRDQDPVELIFERENVTEGDAIERLWTLNLHTWLEHLGEIWMKTVFSGKDVDLTFWARETRTATLANKYMLDLEEALSEHNLKVNSVQVFASPRPGFDRIRADDLSNLDTEV